MSGYGSLTPNRYLVFSNIELLYSGPQKRQYSHARINAALKYRNMVVASQNIIGL